MVAAEAEYSPAHQRKMEVLTVAAAAAAAQTAG
jgi:hypothetical protein